MEILCCELVLVKRVLSRKSSPMIYLKTSGDIVKIILPGKSGKILVGIDRIMFSSRLLSAQSFILN